jgi:site-specific recombinase XerD
MLVPLTSSNVILLNTDGSKDQKHRLRLFAQWLDAMNGVWYAPDLSAYRDELMRRGLAPSSIAAHLSTIRGRYRVIIRNRDAFYAITPTDADPVTRKTCVDEIITRIENAVHPDNAPVRVIKRQDRTDSAHIRLTSEEASALLASPGTNTLRGLRDTAIIAMMLCTGLREMELCNLNVIDLRQRLGGELALHVREGKGAKERLIPYGQLSEALAFTEAWLRSAGITACAVFRSMWRANVTTGVQNLRGRLTVRAVQDILNQYPIMINGEQRTINPHDLRRTYARRLYESGLDLVAIQQNLGHADLKTTLTYIGTLDATKRRPPKIYIFPRLPYP